MTRLSNRLFCALDTTDLETALGLAEVLKEIVGGFKIGLEFYCAHGPAGVRRIAALGVPIFVDLKLHDIPNTVSGAMRAVMPLSPAIVTVHASGGAAMLEAAVDAAAEEAEKLDVRRPWIVGVTVLTSLDAGDLEALSITGSTHSVAARLAKLAERSGLDGAVCAPHEISTLRSTVGENFKLLVPGIRPKGVDPDDQKRVLTPEDAVAAGADFIVVGRPITRSDSPARAARAILESLE